MNILQPRVSVNQGEGLYKHVFYGWVTRNHSWLESDVGINLIS